MVQGQVEAYKMDTNKYPTLLTELETDGYLEQGSKCPDGTEIFINQGKVEQASAP